MKPFTIVDVEQRSPEWFSARAGRLTGTCAADMLATIKSGEAASRRNLRTKLVLERITGRSQDKAFQSEAMKQGVEREPEARFLYEALTGQLVTETGFLSHETLMAGASLDGHIGDFDGICEIKCPMPATHFEYLRTNVIPYDYAKQVLHALWLTGAPWCDWVTFNPEFPDLLQLRMMRVTRDEAAIEEYDTKARAFLAEVNRETEAMLTMAHGFSVAVAAL